VLCGGHWYDGVPELHGGGGDDGFLCGGDVGFGVLWGGDWYDGVLELDGGVR
jgi:hypothetical protein